MKKINKLQINPERLIKNEELLFIKGGDYGTGCCMCICQGSICGFFVATTPDTCNYYCATTLDGFGYWYC